MKRNGHGVKQAAAECRKSLETSRKWLSGRTPGPEHHGVALAYIDNSKPRSGGRGPATL
jgi:hypothetical protein